MHTKINNPRIKQMEQKVLNFLVIKVEGYKVEETLI